MILEITKTISQTRGMHQFQYELIRANVIAASNEGLASTKQCIPSSKIQHF